MKGQALEAATASSEVIVADSEKQRVKEGVSNAAPAKDKSEKVEDLSVNGEDRGPTGA